MRLELLSPQLRIALRSPGNLATFRVLITVDREGALSAAKKVRELTGVDLQRPSAVLRAALDSEQVRLVSDEPWCLEIALAQQLWIEEPDLRPRSVAEQHRPSCPDAIPGHRFDERSMIDESRAIEAKAPQAQVIDLTDEASKATAGTDHESVDSSARSPGSVSAEALETGSR